MLKIIAAVASLMLLPAVASAQSAADQARELGDRIQTTTLDSRSSVDFGQATAVVEAPIATVLAVVRDYRSYQEFIPNLHQSRVLSQRGHNALVYIQASDASQTITMWAQLRIYGRRPQGDTQVVEARMVDGNLESFVARWEITPIDDARTLVRYRILVEPSLPLPSSIFTSENVKAARRTVHGLRAQVREPRYSAARASARNR